MPAQQPICQDEVQWNCFRLLAACALMSRLIAPANVHYQAEIEVSDYSTLHTWSMMETAQHALKRLMNFSFWLERSSKIAYAKISGQVVCCLLRPASCFRYFFARRWSQSDRMHETYETCLPVWCWLQMLAKLGSVSVSHHSIVFVASKLRSIDRMYWFEIPCSWYRGAQSQSLLEGLKQGLFWVSLLGFWHGLGAIRENLSDVAECSG